MIGELVVAAQAVDFDQPVQIPDVWMPLAAALLPILSGLAVRSDGQNWIRALIALVASGVLAVVETLNDGQPDTWETLAVTFLIAVVTFVGSYEGLMRHLGVNRLAASHGIRPSSRGA